jgi:hypothetical protein
LLSDFSPRVETVIRSWFESLTTNGMLDRKFKYLPVRPEPFEGLRTNCDPISVARETIKEGLNDWNVWNGSAAGTDKFCLRSEGFGNEAL